MWGNLIIIGSIIWAIAGVYFIYTLGAAIITWQWKQFWIALLLFIFISLVQIVLAALAES
ncbi:hypothetical protein A2763_03620 [Candidatus Kaiserbacteria bacterium RIFCSPHIGHO2_01_FULL_54_36]|uniref:Major facilitator superfamily (MFS) profile domain-containing protein n=1 Tax=Candidatus Kaiserbacteria bacterium RIFCSPHIGHO2_01_FULL_54_36 TaxID=1798482 RepID=A0A1F6CNK2_9BACT|nr:MAG: hypothetical protein A2763_03620 [Candidatus Kaiserbacteria bacterium RIFCSPHIGHO2_01_FULL_54_36]OGG75952.1 MAG: hypothetical protein A3A41_01715 [Candidatus Kaiserbacteria bacterium RIFCSPLOWO2_01_FULL_54_22]